MKASSPLAPSSPGVPERQLLAAPAPKSSWSSRLARRLVRARFSELRSGSIRWVEGGESTLLGRSSGTPIEVRILDDRFYVKLALGGSVGAAEAYASGYWTCSDLPALFALLLRDQDRLEGLERGWAWLASSLRTLRHRLRRNSSRGSRRNITAHYDLGNEFFATFLDETLMYSCAWFESESVPLEQASRAKIDRICAKLDLGPADHLLEIGTGWGGFALHAARHRGCRVTTTTISDEQFRHARERVERAGLSDRIRVLDLDYRELEGRFDKIVSIEMLEAVGHEYYDTFFQTCRRLLDPRGRMALQTIVIADQHFERAKNEVDFIKEAIFPGSCLPSVLAILDSVTRSTDLRVLDLEDITQHYVWTLRRWRERFLAGSERIRRLGFPESFLRQWEYYFGYCEAGFRERQVGDVQLVLAAADWRPEPEGGAS